MLLLELDRSAHEPLWQQIVDGVRDAVESGTLRTGDRLPPSRTLAERTGVHRSTVVRAYQELWALGYLDSRQGSYSTVRRAAAGLPAAHAAPSTLDWESISSAGAREAVRAAGRLARPVSGPDTIDAASLSPDPRLAPVRELRRAHADVLREDGEALVDYGSPQGLSELRELVAHRMRTHGVVVGSDQVMITGGAQHALDLVAKLLVEPGRRVLLESPTYSLAFPLLRLHGAELVPVPMGAEGMDLDHLEARLGEGPAAMVYTTPNFHNPTGITTSPAHRERLLAICERHRVPLLEDGFEEELKYFGRAVLPIKALDRSGTVIYVGTFSKVVFPGLRVGWVAADHECLRRLAALNRVSNLATTLPAQAALARFCSLGGFESHLRRVHAAYRRRMSALLRGLREHVLRPGVAITEPQGGYTLLVSLASAAGSEDELIARLRRHGVEVAPGSWFYPDRPPCLCFRLSISRLDEQAIEELVRRLAAALDEVVAP